LGEVTIGALSVAQATIVEARDACAAAGRVGVGNCRGQHENACMPLISSFYGVLIYLYWPDTRQHHLPHIHAMYSRDEAVFSIDGAEVIDGSLPRRQTRLVQAWIELRRDELMADWSLAVKGEPVFPIDPLK
jgi:hypothetical protein